MRIVPLLDHRVDWHERGLWLTIPFDMSIRRPRAGDAELSVKTRLSARFAPGARLGADVGARARLDARTKHLRAHGPIGV